MSADVLAAALAAYDAGLCTIQARTDGTKAPMSVPNHGKFDRASGRRRAGWEAYQDDRPSRFTVEGWFGSHSGLGLVCGTISNHLQMFELEGRMLTDDVRRQRFAEALERHGVRGVWDRMTAGYLEDTPGRGVHTMAHVPDLFAGNLVYARTPGPNGTAPPLIETRGDGGFVVVAPSNGTTHPTGKPWTLRQGGFDTIATVTVDEWERLGAAAIECNEVVSTMPTPLPPNRRTKAKSWTGGTVGASWMDVVEEHLEATTGSVGVLEAHGWTMWHDTPEMAYLTRPGKGGGVSGQVKKSNGRFLNYSGTVGGFETWPKTVKGPDGRSVKVPTPTYSTLGVLAVLEFGGDRDAAARAVADDTGIMAAYRAEQDAATQTMFGGGSPPPAQPTRPRTTIRTADQLDVRPAAQLIRGWFPRREVCIVAGKPSAGKGIVLADIIARGTRGTQMPNGDRIIGSFKSAVVCLPGEDDAAEWARRLTVADAQLDRVLLVETTPDDAGQERPVNMNTITAVVEDLARDGAHLVVIDSLTGLSNASRLDTNKGEVRAVLDALSALARVYDVTIVVIHHTRKAQGDPLDTLQGNTQIGAASRSVLVAVEERVSDGAEPDVRLFGVAKLNGSKRSAPVGFRTVGKPLLHSDGQPMRDDRGDVAYVPRVEWVTDRTFTQGELIAASNGTVLRAQDRDQAAATILGNGPMLSTEYVDAMGDAGFSADQARRAREHVAKSLHHDGRWWTYAAPMSPAEAKRAVVALAADGSS